MKYFKHVSFFITLALAAQLPLAGMKRQGDDLEGHDQKRVCSGQDLDDKPVSARTRSHFSYFDRIPVELMPVIFEYLELQDLLQLNQTCKSLQPVAQQAIDAAPYDHSLQHFHDRLYEYVCQGSHFVQAIKIVRDEKGKGVFSQGLCHALVKNGRESELAIKAARWGMNCNYYHRYRESSLKIYKVLAQQGYEVEEAFNAAQAVLAETGDGSVVYAANQVLQVPQIYSQFSISWYDDWYHPKK